MAMTFKEALARMAEARATMVRTGVLDFRELDLAREEGLRAFAREWLPTVLKGEWKYAGTAFKYVPMIRPLPRGRRRLLNGPKFLFDETRGDKHAYLIFDEKGPWSPTIWPIHAGNERATAAAVAMPREASIHQPDRTLPIVLTYPELLLTPIAGSRRRDNQRGERRAQT